MPELNDVTAEQRTFPFKYMPPGEKYLLVLSGATHGNFGGNPVRGGARFRAEAGASNPHVDSVVIAATTAFWKTTLRNDAEARAFLRGSAFKTTLVAGDQLQIK